MFGMHERPGCTRIMGTTLAALLSTRKAISPMPSWALAWLARRLQQMTALLRNTNEPSLRQLLRGMLKVSALKMLTKHLGLAAPAWKHCLS